MKRRDDRFEPFGEDDDPLLESLGRLSRVRVAVSVEDRVMAAVRTQAVVRPRRVALDARQKATLGSVAAIGAAAEVVFWAAVAFVALRLPGAASLRVAFGWMPDATGPLNTLARASAEVLQAVVSTMLVLVHGAAYVLPPAPVLGVAFVVAVTFLTFIAVRRDLHRSPAARGFQ